MSDTNDKPLAEDEERNDSTRRLRVDLKSLPKVSAPLDFEYHLREKIANLAAAKAAPWWKTFFFRREGGFRVPVIAYGSAAAVMLLAFAIYAYDAVDFEIQMPIKQQRVLDAEFNDLPAVEDVESVEKFERSRVARENEKQTLAPVEEAYRTAPTDNLQHAPQPSAETGASSEGDDDAVKLKKSMTPGSSGIPGRQAFVPITDDSFAVADSLRKLDSLRRLRQDYKTDPPDDTR